MKDKSEKNDLLRRWSLRLALVLFDVFAVNFSYYLALLLRFYVNGQFHLAGTLYIPLFFQFAPWYTLCCIVVFWAFKLYNGMWKYAGPNDLNRVAGANAVTCVIQVAGTLLFIRRMPLTYYILGTVIQFVLICASRFSYRIFAMEFSRYVKNKNAEVNVMIVGAGETARSLLRQLESDNGNVEHPVCVLDCRNSEPGRLFDGLPVVGGLDELKKAADKYGVKCVILADSVMPPETREKIRSLCAEAGLEVQDFFVYSQSVGDRIHLRKLLEYAGSPLTLRLDGDARDFENGEQALAALPGRYTVRSVGAKGGRLCVEIEKDAAVLNNVDEPWARDYTETTGEEISFF